MILFRWMTSLVLLAAATGAQAQQQSISFPFNQTGEQAAAQETEQQDLQKALAGAQTSPVDLVRALEAHLAKYPNSAQKGEIEKILAKASIDNKDDGRIIKYGIPALESIPDDVLLLDRVAGALLNVGGSDNAEKAIHYARTLEDMIDKMPPPQGKDIVPRQEERDRAQGRMLLYQARARVIMGQNDEAMRLAIRAFDVYPNEESARAQANILLRMNDERQAIARLADAFAVPDDHVAESQRQDDRLQLGTLYAKLNGSEKGLGDLILSSYDRTSTLVETRRKKLLAMDPNSTLIDPMEFTVTRIDGKKLKLSSFRGKVVVMDFWATWCGPCRVQHPLYEQVKQSFGDRDDVIFLGMNTDEDRSLVDPFLTDQKWDKNTYFDDGLARFFQVSSIPTTLLLDKRGRVASRMNGFLPDSFVEQITARIRETLNASN